MCLSSVNEVYDVPSTLIMDGWKEFDVSGGKLRFAAFAFNGSKDVPMDKWIQASTEHAKKGTIKANDGSDYQAGFHVFAEEAECKPISKFRRVFVRKITCLGNDDGRGGSGKKVIIAQELYVPSDKNGWPPTHEEEQEERKGLLDRMKNMIPGNC
jgi:hypothetical protein